jgi:hypothetical protein
LDTDLVIFTWAFEAFTPRVVVVTALAGQVIVLTGRIRTLEISICIARKRCSVPVGGWVLFTVGSKPVTGDSEKRFLAHVSEKQAKMIAVAVS